MGQGRARIAGQVRGTKWFGNGCYRPISLTTMVVTVHTNLNGPTSDGRRGIVFLSSAAGRPGTRLRYRRCSSDACICTPKRPLGAATSHRGGIECAGWTARRPSCLRVPGRERWSLRRGQGACALPAIMCGRRQRGQNKCGGPWASVEEKASRESDFSRVSSCRSAISHFLTCLVRKCFRELLLSRNLCYKPEHA